MISEFDVVAGGTLRLKSETVSLNGIFAALVSICNEARKGANVLKPRVSHLGLLLFSLAVHCESPEKLNVPVI